MILTRMNRRINRYTLLPYLLILPALIFALVFKIYPIFYSFFEAFHFKGVWSVANFESMFADKTFWNALFVTIKMNVIMIPLQIVISFIMAMLVNTTLKGMGTIRSLLYLPVTISMPVAAICWMLILNFNSGVVNSFLMKVFNLERQGFFNDPNQALWCAILLCTWKGCGYWMMFYLAGLKGINVSLYEAAEIDGAGFFARLLNITIPLLKKTTLFVLVANTSVNLLLFAPMQLITEGGPSGSTDVLMYEAYKQAFKYGNYGKGSAITCVLVVIILIVVYFQFRLVNDQD